MIGIDEAGRGPLIGSLFIVGVSTDKELGCEIKDSKLLTQKKREEIFEKYKDKVDWVYFEIKPEEIDSKNLNELEAFYIAKIINKLAKENETVIIDLPEKKEKFLERLNKYLKVKVNLVLEHKADLNYRVVSLASIFAKVLREKHVKELKEKLNYNFGSGYPSDPKVRELIEKLRDDKELRKKFMPFIRKKWKSVSFLNSKITDFLPTIKKN